jgi:hypothetical protein
MEKLTKEEFEDICRVLSTGKIDVFVPKGYAILSNIFVFNFSDFLMIGEVGILNKPLQIT